MRLIDDSTEGFGRRRLEPLQGIHFPGDTGKAIKSIKCKHPMAGAQIVHLPHDRYKQLMPNNGKICSRSLF